MGGLEDKGFSFSFDGIKENVAETITVYNHERVNGVEGVCLNDFKIVWTTLGMHSGVVAFEADEDVLRRWSPFAEMKRRLTGRTTKRSEEMDFVMVGVGLWGKDGSGGEAEVDSVDFWGE